MIFSCQLQMPASSKFGLSQAWTSTVARWTHCHKWALDHCVVFCRPWIHVEPWAGCSPQEQMCPSWAPLVVITWSVMGKGQVEGQEEHSDMPLSNFFCYFLFPPSWHWWYQLMPGRGKAKVSTIVWQSQLPCPLPGTKTCTKHVPCWVKE